MSRPGDNRDDKDDSILRDILGDDSNDRFERRPRVSDLRDTDYRGHDYMSGRYRHDDYDRYPEEHRGIRGSYSYDEFPRNDPYCRPEPDYYELEHRRPRYEEPYVRYEDRRDSQRDSRLDSRSSYEYYERLAAPETDRIVTQISSDTGRKRRYSEEGEVTSGSASIKPKKFSPIVFDLKAPERLRFFTARCNYYDMFAKSKRDAVWRAPQYVVNRISQALHEERECRVLLVFTVHGSQYWQGIAEVDRKRRIELDSKLARVPLIWIALGDVSYMAAPRIPDLHVGNDAVKESFEIPEEFGREFFPLFDHSIANDPTRTLGTDKLRPFLKQ